MKKYNWIFIVFVFLLFCGKANADVYDFPANLKTVSKQMPKIESIKCKFKQEKYLQNLQNPLVSSGDFEFVENKGVYFYTTYPIKSAVNYTNKNYKQINDIINAISQKKYSKLEEEFEFFFMCNSNNWTLGMKPKKTSGAYNYISDITVEGADYIHKINLSQTNGNKTTIWFTK